MITGKIAEILSEYSVVINRGSSHGVAANMKFVIYTDGPEIKDPDNPQKILGRLEIPKGRIKIVHVQPNFSVGESDTKSSVSLANVTFTGLLGAEQTTPLKVDKERLEKSGVAEPVRIGDKVREL